MAYVQAESILANTFVQKTLRPSKRLFIATNEKKSFFSLLTQRYVVYVLADFKKFMNSSLTTYQRSLIEQGISLRARKKVETFNDLTSDPRDGVNHHEESNISGQDNVPGSRG